jgi:hypothetical protein
MESIKLPPPDWSKATDVNCKCGHQYFTEVYIIKRFSKLLTGYPEDKIIPVSVLKCEACGEILTELLPPQLKSTK